MAPPASLTRRRAAGLCAFAALTVAMCAALLSAAALVPAPPAALPLLVVVCIGAPMVVACDLPRAIAALRRPRSPALDGRSLQALHRQLDALPETNHPLGY